MVSKRLEEALSPLLTVAIDRLVRGMVRSLLPEIATRMVQEEINIWVGEGQKKLEQKIQETFAPYIYKKIWELARDQVMQELSFVAEGLILEELHRLQHVKKWPRSSFRPPIDFSGFPPARESRVHEPEWPKR